MILYVATSLYCNSQYDVASTQTKDGGVALICAIYRKPVSSLVSDIIVYERVP